MDLANVLEIYFSNLPTEMLFSGQQPGDMREMIEEIVQASGSLLKPDTPEFRECAGFYPVALVEYPTLFEEDQDSSQLATKVFTQDLGAHLFQIYFLSEKGYSMLIPRIMLRNRNRSATRFFVGGKPGMVSSCKRGEQLYTLLVAKTPIPRNIAAA